MPVRTRSGDLGWLIDDFVARVPGAVEALVLTADGLVLVTSESVSDGIADHLAAVTSGLASLTEGAARCLDTEPVRQVIVEMTAGYLFVSRISDGSALALRCDDEGDFGLVGYEMSLLIERIGAALTPELISEVHPPAALGSDPGSMA